jgi:5'(3')-deoxyribonucleotidase
MKKIVYIDLDNTLADYLGMAKIMNVSPSDAKHIPGFFRNLKPIENAIYSYNILNKYFDVYILSTGPWSNPTSFVEKVEWVKEYLPNAYKNIIFSHHKDLNKGDYLIDDSTKNGAAEFEGEHIQIHSDKFPNWDSVIDYILRKEHINLT